MNKQSQYQVIILGGGPAGCASALALMQKGISEILVVEAGDYQDVRIGDSIPPDTRMLFERLGIWNDFQKEGHDVCYGSCSSWGSEDLGYNDFLLNPLGHGWHLDRSRFNAFLAAKAETHGADLLSNTRFQGRVERCRHGFSIRLQRENEEEQWYQSEFVIDATGHHARFAKKMGAKRIFLDRLVCVYGFFDMLPEVDFSNLTMLEAVEYGWWYAAKLPNGTITAAAASDSDIIQQMRLTQTIEWLYFLSKTQHISKAMRGCQFKENRVRPYSAPSFFTHPPCGERWAAVGDAAAAFDPISSQGIYKSLADGLLAADALVEYSHGNQNAFNAYRDKLHSRWHDYTINRDYFYRQETRWPTADFWKKRQPVEPLLNHSR